MTELPQTEGIEVKIEEVGLWVKKISENEEVADINPKIIKEVLVHFGADFESLDQQRKLLERYTNKGKRKGLDAVWGRDKVGEFKKFAQEQVVKTEREKGIRLPKLEKSGSKTSGMLQFFGQLTSFAAGVLSFEDFKLYTETRALNGKLWQEGKKDERIKIKVPTSDKPIGPSSFPPGFPAAAWEKIKSWQ